MAPDPANAVTSARSVVVVDAGLPKPIWSSIALAPATRIVALPAVAGPASESAPPWAVSP
jgi:hypothetical protein